MKDTERLAWAQNATPREVIDAVRDSLNVSYTIVDWTTFALNLATRLENALDRDEFENAGLEMAETPGTGAESCIAEEAYSRPVAAEAVTDTTDALEVPA